MEPTEQLSYILPTLSALVDRIEPTQLDNSTPLHRVHRARRARPHDRARWFVRLLVPRRGSSRVERAPVHGRVPAAEFRKTMDDLLDAVISPGAMERTIAAPVGEMPGSTFARFVAFDGLIHGWDLASATGLDYAAATRRDRSGRRVRPWRPDLRDARRRHVQGSDHRPR